MSEGKRKGPRYHSTDPLRLLFQIRAASAGAAALLFTALSAATLGWRPLDNWKVKHDSPRLYIPPEAGGTATTITFRRLALWRPSPAVDTFYGLQIAR